MLSDKNARAELAWRRTERLGLIPSFGETLPEDERAVVTYVIKVARTV